MRGQHRILSLPLPGASRVVWSPFLPWGLSSSTGAPGRQGEPGQGQGGRGIRRWRLGRLWRLANDRARAKGPESQSLKNSLEGGAGPLGRGDGNADSRQGQRGARSPGVRVEPRRCGTRESLPCSRGMSCPGALSLSSADSLLSTYCAPHSHWALSTQWAPPRAALPSGPTVCWGRGLQWVIAGHSGRGDEGRPGALGAPGGSNLLFRAPGGHLGLVMTGR